MDLCRSQLLQNAAELRQADSDEMLRRRRLKQPDVVVTARRKMEIRRWEMLHRMETEEDGTCDVVVDGQTTTTTTQSLLLLLLL